MVKILDAVTILLYLKYENIIIAFCKSRTIAKTLDAMITNSIYEI